MKAMNWNPPSVSKYLSGNSSLFPIDKSIIFSWNFGGLIAFYTAIQITIFMVVTDIPGEGQGFEGFDPRFVIVAFLTGFMIWFIIMLLFENVLDPDWRLLALTGAISHGSAFAISYELSPILSFTCDCSLLSMPLHMCGSCSLVGPILVFLGQLALSSFIFALGSVRLVPSNELPAMKEIRYLEFHSKRWWNVIIGVSLIVPVIIGIVPVFINMFDGGYLGRLFPLIADFSAGFLIGVFIVLVKQKEIEKRMKKIIKNSEKKARTNWRGPRRLN